MSERCERRQALFLRVKPKILSFVICAGNKGVFFLVPFLMYKKSTICYVCETKEFFLLLFPFLM